LFKVIRALSLFAVVKERVVVGFFFLFQRKKKAFPNI